MEINKKIIYGIDLLFLVGTLLTLFFLVGYVRPLVIAPINNLETSNSSVLFTFEKGSIVLIDDNLNFSSPDKIYAEDNLVINLKPGIYYWKVSGITDSQIRTLTIISQIDLRLRESENGVEVVNSGNEELSVEVYEKEKLVDSFVLEKDNSQKVAGTKVIGEIND